MKVKIINKSDNPLPKYESELASGLDLRASFKYISPQNLLKLYGDGEVIFSAKTHNKTLVRLDPGSRALIPTDIYVQAPEGYELQLRPRSGLALREGISLVNTPGTVDADYRGNVGILVINHGLETVWIEDGERICQAVLAKTEKIEWEEVTELDKSERNGGFGSTNLDKNGNYVAGK